MDLARWLNRIDLILNEIDCNSHLSYICCDSKIIYSCHDDEISISWIEAIKSQIFGIALNSDGI